MADNVALIDPRKIEANPDNPRLIFRQDELEQLEESINKQGILVPLAVHKEGARYRLLDGERRWKCALKLGLPSVPVLIQPKPDRMGNLMLMFATHKARRDWDPLPTAMKLEELENEFFQRFERRPNEGELAGVASITRGEVRRLKKLLALPVKFRTELLKELEKPRSEQRLTVDQVLESSKAAEGLRKRKIISKSEESELREALIGKFRAGLITSTVDPRKLLRIARAVERSEIEKSNARRVLRKLVDSAKYTIDDAFQATVEQTDFEFGTKQLMDRCLRRLQESKEKGFVISAAVKSSIQAMIAELKKLL